MILLEIAKIIDEVIKSKDLLRLGQYRQNMGNWEKYYPRENFLYLFFDDIKKNPQEQLDLVCDFLGTSKIKLHNSLNEVTEKPVNPAPSYPMPVHVHSFLTNFYNEQTLFLEKKFNRDLSHWSEDAASLEW